MEDYKDILSDSGRITAEIAGSLIRESKTLFSEMIDLSFTKPYPYNMRASRVIQIYCETETDAIFPFLEDIIPQIIQTKTSGVRRNYLKIIFDTVPLEKLPQQALLLNYCFDWLASNKEPIALRYYSLNILLLFAEKEPLLINEIELIMESLELDSLKGLKSRWKHVKMKKYSPK